MVSYITKSCSDPAKAIQIFTYLLSEEGQILTTYGIEGVTYTVNAEGKYELLPEIKEIQEKENDRFKKEYRLGDLSSLDMINIKHSVMMLILIPLSRCRHGDRVNWFHISFWRIQILMPVQQKHVPIVQSDRMGNFAGKYAPCRYDTSFEAALDEYKQFLADNDWDAIVAVKNEKMAKNVIKLGE